MQTVNNTNHLGYCGGGKSGNPKVPYKLDAWHISIYEYILG